MGSRSMRSAAMAVAVLMAVALMAPEAAAQGSTPACVQKLIPCASFLGTTTTPSEGCCSSMKEAVTNELPCLCALLNNKELTKTINLNQALELPRRCGINTGTNLCNSVSTNGTTGNGPAGSPSSAPPATPGGPNNAAAVARMGASGVVVLLAFWWSLVA